jgi:nucleoside-diphosphate-sugar epimerase
MMIKHNIILTGASGFLGSEFKSRLPEKLNEQFVLHTPTSSELNLLDEVSVDNYFRTFMDPVQVVIHCAGIVPKKWDEQEPGTMYKNILMFELLRKHHKGYIINMSSGAAHDRGKDIIKFGIDHNPTDEYGLSKSILERLEPEYTMHLRLYGVFGPSEQDSRMIKGNLKKYINREHITINQDCKIDYFSIYDLVEILANIVNQDNYDWKYLMEVGYGEYTTLSEVARIINSVSTYKVPIEIKESGWSKSYYNNSEDIAHYASINTEVSLLGLEKSITKMYRELLNEQT